MPTAIIKKRFTVDEYHRMGEAGILGPEDRVELIDGEIIQMSPIGQRHAARVARATALFIRVLGDRAVLGPQNPVQLSVWTEPQPDIVVFKPRPDFYEHKKPTPDDVLLLMEISDTSLPYDLKVKLPHFAAALISEVWIQDVNADVVHVFREPRGNTYKTSMQLKRGDAVSPLAFPDIRFSMDDLFSAPLSGNRQGNVVDEDHACCSAHRAVRASRFLIPHFKLMEFFFLEIDAGVSLIHVINGFGDTSGNQNVWYS